MSDNISGQEKTIGTSANTSHTVKRKQKGNGKKRSSIASEGDLAEGTQDANDVVNEDASACQNLPTSNSPKAVYPGCDDASCSFRHELPDTLGNGSGRV